MDTKKPLTKAKIKSADSSLDGFVLRLKELKIVRRNPCEFDSRAGHQHINIPSSPRRHEDFFFLRLFHRLMAKPQRSSGNSQDIHARIDSHDFLLSASDTTKTKKSFRTLPFDPGGVIENLLLEMKQNQENWKQLFGRSYDTKDEAYVFLRPNGQRYKTNWITMAFSDFLKKNNMRKIRFHDLRHTCATMLRHTGVPMEDIQKFLGHSTITTTEGIYAHFDDSQHKSTIMKLSDYLSNKSKDDKNGSVVKAEKNKEAQ